MTTKVERMNVSRIVTLFLFLSFILLVAPSRAAPGYALGIRPSARLGLAPMEVTFQFTVFTQSGGRFREFRIDFGDGTSSRLPSRGGGLSAVSHVYRESGTYRAVVTGKMADGEDFTSSTTIRVRPRRFANPRELLRVHPSRGMSPHRVTIDIGGETLPFVARAARLDLGDGTRLAVTPLTQYHHTYSRPGDYRLRLLVRGRAGNLARSSASVHVVEEPSVDLSAWPDSGRAPLEVLLVPWTSDDALPARLLLGEEVISRGYGRHRHTLREPGTHTFKLQVRGEGNRVLEKVVNVEVEEGPAGLAGLYEHREGIVRIRDDGGNFTGSFEVIPRSLLARGYRTGETIVRGSYVTRIRFARDRAEATPTSTDAGLPTGSISLPGASDSSGAYLVRSGECPEQWGEYSFTLPQINDRSTLQGVVLFKPVTSLGDLANDRLGLPTMRPGIIGRIRWVKDMMDRIRAAGLSGQPDDCALEDNGTATMDAVFTPVTEERAREIVEAIRNDIEDVWFFDENLDGDSYVRWEDESDRRIRDPLEGFPVVSQDPVILHTGEFICHQVDISLPGTGNGFTFERTYRSQDPNATTLGHGWRHNHQFALTRIGSDFVFLTPRGSWIRLAPLTDSLFASPAGHRLRIEGERRLFRDRDGTIVAFQEMPGDPEHSRVLYKEDREGHRVTYGADFLGRVQSIEDATGRKHGLSYDPARGLLVRLDVEGGISFLYEHDDDGNLIAVRRRVAGEESTSLLHRYAYDTRATDIGNQHYLVKLWDPSDPEANRPQVENRYGRDPESPDFNRVIYQRAGRSEERFRYDRHEAEGGTSLDRTIVEANGRAREQHLFDHRGLEVEVRYEMTEGDEVILRRVFDEKGLLIEETKPEGDRRVITRDEHGFPHKITFHPRPGSTLPALAYDMAYEPVFGRLESMTGPRLDDGSPIAKEASLSTERTFDYEESGLLASPHDLFELPGVPPGRGDLNGDGRVLPGRGKWILRKEASSGPVRFQMNEDGRLEHLILSDGSRRRYTYGQSETAGPDRLSRIDHASAEGVSLGFEAFQYDANHRLVHYRNLDGVGVGYVHDALGNNVALIPDDSSHASVHRNLDSLGRVRARTLMTRDERERKATKKPTSEFLLGADGLLLEEKRWLSPTDSVTRRFSYDPYGRLIGVASSDGDMKLGRDGLGRVVQIEVWREETKFQETRRYDKNGSLVGVTRPGVLDLAIQHDGHGRPVLLEDGEGFQLQQEFDTLGRLIGQTLRSPDVGGARTVLARREVPPGKERQRTRRAVRSSFQASTETPPVWVAWDDRGRVLSIEGETAKGNGNLIYRYNWDLWGRLQNATEPGLRREFRYDPTGWLASVTFEYPEMDSTGVRLLEYERDGMGRITRETMKRELPWDDQETFHDLKYDWDAGNRLVGVALFDRPLARYEYDVLGRLASREEFGGLVRRSYVHAPDGVTMIDVRGHRHKAESKDGTLRLTHEDASGEAIESASWSFGPGGSIVGLESPGYELEAEIEERENGTHRTERHRFHPDRGEKVVRQLRGPDESSEWHLEGSPALVYERREDGGIVKIGKQEIVLQYDGRGLRRHSTGDLTIERIDEPLDASGRGRSRTTCRKGDVIVFEEIREFDGGRPARILWRPSGHEREVHRDERGRITEVVTKEPGKEAESTRYDYDRFGNRIGMDHNGKEVSIGRERGFQISSWEGSPVDFDAEGRVHRIGERAFSHDASGRLIETHLGDGTTIRYTRDPFGRVVSRTHGDRTTRYLHRGSSLMAEVAADGARIIHVRDPAGHLLGLWNEGRLRLALTRPDGTLLALVDEEGHVEEQVFDPFGVLDPSLSEKDGEPSPLYFQGMLRDPVSGIFLTPTRSYLPETGEFLEPEPLGPAASIHPYLLADGDPLYLKDPSGLQSLGPGPTPSSNPIRRFFEEVASWFGESGERLEEDVTGAMEGEEEETRESSYGGGGYYLSPAPPVRLPPKPYVDVPPEEQARLIRERVRREFLGYPGTIMEGFPRGPDRTVRLHESRLDEERERMKDELRERSGVEAWLRNPGDAPPEPDHPMEVGEVEEATQPGGALEGYGDAPPRPRRPPGGMSGSLLGGSGGPPGVEQLEQIGSSGQVNQAPPGEGAVVDPHGGVAPPRPPAPPSPISDGIPSPGGAAADGEAVPDDAGAPEESRPPSMTSALGGF